MSTPPNSKSSLDVRKASLVMSPTESSNRDSFLSDLHLMMVMLIRRRRMTIRIIKLIKYKVRLVLETGKELIKPLCSALFSSIFPISLLHSSCSMSTVALSFRYPLAREGVTAPGGHDCLAHTMQKVINIVGLTALRLALFLGYE